MRTTRPATTAATEVNEVNEVNEVTADLAARAAGEQPAGATDRPANRAERRAARRGRATEGHTSGPAVPRNTGPSPHAKPTHVRADFAARRSG